MNLTIELSDESVARLKQQAAAHGLSLEAWVQELAQEKARVEEGEANRWKSQAAAARILEIQKRVKPDPEGWTIHDYIDRGRP
jgi:plasmid stability protein